MLHWQSNSDDFEHASENEIIEMFMLVQTGGRARRVSENILVKKCLQREFGNQFFAWKNLNGTSLRVPKPVRYIRGSLEDENGFMVMEFLDGCSWEEVKEVDESCVNTRVHKAVQYMHRVTPQTTHQRIYPGPLDGGRAESFPWGRGQKEAEDTFRSLEDVVACANKRLFRHAKRNKLQNIRSINLQGQKLAICHGDLAPRNILILADGQVALLDWEWMCLYPAIFDVACLSMLDIDHPHEKQKLLIDCLTLDVCIERTKVNVEEDMTTLRIVDRESLDDRIKRTKVDVEEDMKTLRIVDRESVRYHFRQTC
jgi:aminoglycoside phosphotransferase (APT) family kinase protein